jgi:transcriptional regulator with XRE-family HTH domain
MQISHTGSSPSPVALFEDRHRGIHVQLPSTQFVLDPGYLRNLRRARGVTAPELSAMLSVSSSSVHRWERGERLPGPHHVRGLAQALDVPACEVTRFFDVVRSPTPPKAGLHGTGLRRMRHARGFSGTELGDLVGVPAYTVYNWEAGRARIPVDRVPRLAAALDIDEERFARLVRQGPATPAAPPPQPLGQLAALRARAGLSQVQAAKRLGIARSSLRAWEAGKRPTLYGIRAMADLYGVSTSKVAEAVGVPFPRQLDPSTWAPGDLPEAIRVLREWSGLTQRALAELCGAQKDTVRAWENARCRPTRRFRQALEQTLRLPHGALQAAYGDR